ncbi:MAG: hypothetical protein IJE42_08135 [Bacteroidaceae bacterium]|nr:hypothetical protein [Bacteroidaceae bacterium]
MKKLFGAAFFVLGMSIIASCDSFSGPSKSELKAEVDSLSNELNIRNAELDEFMSIFNKVSEGFNQINIAENRVEMQRDAVENGSKSASDKIASDIAYIQKRMKENRELIAELQQKLKSSNNNSAQLKKAIESLQAELVTKGEQIKSLQSELAAKNIHIQELDAAVNSLTAEKENLLAQNEENNKTMAEQDKALNAAWYIVAGKKELKDMKVLTNTGLFKKGDVMEDVEVDKSGFVQIDIRNTNEIGLNSKSGKLLSSHPEDSYTIVEDENGLETIKITNPERFWSITRYLVVQVK